MKAVRKLSLEIKTNEPSVAKRIKRIYSYLNKFSFFRGLLTNKIKINDPSESKIFDDKIKLIVLGEWFVFKYKVEPLNIKKKDNIAKPKTFKLIDEPLFMSPRVNVDRINIKRNISGAKE